MPARTSAPAARFKCDDNKDPRKKGARKTPSNESDKGQNSKRETATTKKAGAKKKIKIVPPTGPFRVGRARTGLGLFATEEIKRGAFIIEYVGERLATKEAELRNSKYLFEVSNRTTVDGACRENTARYINHACKPNAETEVIRGRIYVTARKRIHEGDEITIDYGKNYFEMFIKPFGCKCQTCQPGR